MPAKSGLRLRISPRMQPVAQTSAAWLYPAESMISGARYHRVTTYSVSLASLSPAQRDRPRSPTRRSQLLCRKRLEGLRSRCSTFAECRYLRPRSTW